MNTDELIERLEEIHSELVPPPSEEMMKLYENNEVHNPCGCSICRLIDDLIVAAVLNQGYIQHFDPS